MFNRLPRRPFPMLQGKGNEPAPYGEFRTPLTTLKQTDKSVSASFELPGVDRKDIELNVTDDAIEVKVQKKAERETKKKGFYSYESHSQHFYRRLPLPTGVDARKAQAEYKNGLLKVDVPKTKKLIESKKRIEIK
jgi:HSP20 family protein